MWPKKCGDFFLENRYPRFRKSKYRISIEISKCSNFELSFLQDNFVFRGAPTTVKSILPAEHDPQVYKSNRAREQCEKVTSVCQTSTACNLSPVDIWQTLLTTEITIWYPYGKSLWEIPMGNPNVKSQWEIPMGNLYGKSTLKIHGENLKVGIPKISTSLKLWNIISSREINFSQNPMYSPQIIVQRADRNLKIGIRNRLRCSYACAELG